LYGIIGVQPTVGATIPAGLIAMWSGSIGSIPSGWYLCDGSNGTPNLADRFVIGAGSTYAVNGTGGVSSVTLTTNNMPAHTHTATSTDSGHTHGVSPGNNLLVDNASGGGSYFGGGTKNLSAITIGTGNANITTTNASAGSGTSFSILNPYYALAFIQKS
jgi:microcystin-dependent protein